MKSKVGLSHNLVINPIISPLWETVENSRSTRVVRWCLFPTFEFRDDDATRFKSQKALLLLAHSRSGRCRQALPW